MYASVLIITYNHSSYIEECLRRAKDERDQLSDRDIEIIVIDDGSTDDTATKARQFVDETLSLHVQENGGPSASMNSAFGKAKGDRLVILSGDDLFMPGGLGKRLSHLDQSGADLISSRPHVLSSSPRQKSVYENEVFRCPDDGSPENVYQELFYHSNFICAPSVAMKRSVWDRLGPFRTDLLQLQDYEYWLRASALGFSFSFSKDPTTQYRIHSNNLSTKNPVRVRREFDAVRRQSASFLTEPVLRSILSMQGVPVGSENANKKHLLPFLFLQHEDTAMKRVGLQLLDDLMANEDDRAIMTSAFGKSPHSVYNMGASFGTAGLKKSIPFLLQRIIRKIRRLFSAYFTL